MKIDLLLPPASRAGYGVLGYFTKSLKTALERSGAECRLLESTPTIVSEIVRHQPDYTLSFNGLLPDSNGHFLCDSIQIPHVACLVDSPNNLLELAQSPLNIITSIDSDWAAFFKGLRVSHALFMPHAVDREFYLDTPTEKIYDATFVSSCLDYEERRNSWAQLYGEPLSAVLHDAVDIAFENPLKPYYDAFAQAMDRRLRLKGDVDVKNLDYGEILDHLEVTIRGIDRVNLLRSITTPVHVFGSTSGTKGWDEYLKDTPHIIHGRLTYEDALDTFRKSKVVLNSSQHIRQGSHERILAGVLAGAAVITNYNPYMADHFVEDQEMLYYHVHDYAAVNDLLDRYLEDEAARQTLILRGQQKVLSAHTWDHRAKDLLSYLSSRENSETT